MGYHKLLQKQITKLLNNSDPTPELESFLAAVNDSYNGFERDKELWTHAFHISEQEYQELNRNLEKEANLKKLTLDKIGEAIYEIDEGNVPEISRDINDLLDPLNYLKAQIIKRKEIEDNLAKTAQILTTLVSNLNAGILMEDENRKILYINETFCDMFGIKADPEMMIGADCSNSAEESKHLFDDPEYFLSRIKTVLSNKTKVIDEELQLKDGQYFERTYIPLYINETYKGHLWKYNDITERKYNEIKLSENQAELQRLSLVASANTNGVLLTDKEGKIFWSNEGYENLTGFSRAELFGKTPIEVAKGPKSDRNVIRGMVEAYYSHKSFNIEVAYYRKDLTSFWGRVKGQPILDKNNNLLHFFSIIEDISLEKAQEQEIQRLSLVASANSKGVFIQNNDLNFDWVNPAYESITGYVAEELMDKNPIELFFSKTGDQALLKRIHENEKLAKDYKEEFLHARKDGSTFYCRLNMQFVNNPEGEILQRFGILDDITHEKNAEQAILIREEKYRNIIANMNLGLLEVDNEDIIQFANQSFMEMSGFDYDELIGHKASEKFIMGENIRTIQKKNENRLAGESDAYELPIRNKRGELKYWLISGAPRFNATGEVIGSIGIHLDITQQKVQEIELIDARERAEESSKAKEVFLANMSHEIRTPLNAIIGMLRELGKESINTKHRAYLNNADTASRHLLSIINNILDMSKIEAGEFQLESRHFSLHSVINESVSIISSDAKEKLIKLEVHEDPNLNHAFIGDPVRLRQILLNIMGNSIKFTDKGYISVDSKVIESTKFDQTVLISITDTGIGMDKTFMKNLFKKFSQESQSTARKYGGTGLGMAITYELVQLMGGEITIDSEKGKGTKISIMLPLKIGKVAEIKTNSVSENFNELKDLKVLLAEDNEMNRLVAKNTLSYFGMIITEAENGKVAVDLMEQGDFDIVLMDLHMPEMDGLEATRIIRERFKNNIPIIALTANAFKKEIDLCLEAGMNDFVTKPFEEIILLQTIQKYIKSDIFTNKNKVKSAMGNHSDPEKIYDLSRLNEIGRGDVEFLEKMIGLFIDQAQLSMQQIKDAYAGNDFKTINETAHRIKASIGNMGILSIKQEISDLEKMALENPESKQILELITMIDSVLVEVIKQLKVEFH